MMKNSNAYLFALLAALLYGISTPISKILLDKIAPTFLAALLYLGAGVGMAGILFFRRVFKKRSGEFTVSKKELPFVIGMVLLDIAAPIFLLIGLKMTYAANASLLNNLEIVATALIALFLFKESIGKRMWVAIGLITFSGILLSLEGTKSFSFSTGSFFILLACISWGFENNCTRMLSLKDPIHTVLIKGFGSGFGALGIAFFTGGISFSSRYVLLTLLLGFVAYGMSIVFYIKAQRELGAARTSSFYAMAPFIGVLVSWIVLRESITVRFLIALGVMLLGTYVIFIEKHHHKHLHQGMTHEHMHNHQDGHHEHYHEELVKGEHSHIHTHEQIEHDHNHLPDMHHRHLH